MSNFNISEKQIIAEAQESTYSSETASTTVPICNTGATSTIETTNELPVILDNNFKNDEHTYHSFRIDYLSASIPDKNENTLIALIGIPKEYFTSPYSGYGYYRTQIKYHNISINYNGTSTMGSLLTMTGQGCREFERLSKSENPWVPLLQGIFDKNGHVNRIDIAIDYYGKNIDIDVIQDKLKKGEYVGTFKKWTLIETNSTSRDKNRSKTIYMGSNKSNLKIRCYKKYDDVKRVTCTRLELEYRKVKANMVGKSLINNNLGQVALSLIDKKIRFLEPTADTNKYRWPVSSWWTEFLGSGKKIPVKMESREENLDKSIKWLFKQVSQVLADVVDKKGSGILNELLKEGRKKRGGAVNSKD